MEALGQAVAEFLRPLSITLILAAVFGGLFFGRIYNRKLNIPPTYVYHKLIAGVGFIFFMFLFRWAAFLIDSTGTAVVGSFFGWLGIMALWSMFCAFIWIGQNKLP